MVEYNIFGFATAKQGSEALNFVISQFPSMSEVSYSVYY
jgi:hypothetical protein